MTEGNPMPYRPVEGLARVVIVLLAVTAVISGIAAAVDVALLDDPGSYPWAVGWIQYGISIGTGLVFVAWLRRVYRNLRSFGVTLRFRPFWAIAGWLVPIVSLFRPKQILNDVWRASATDLHHSHPAAWVDQPVPASLTLWWLVFLLAGLLNCIAAGLDDPDTSMRAYVVSDSLSMIAALLAVWVVRAVTARQVVRARLPALA